MKICLVTEHFPPHIGGVEIVFQEYAKRLSLKGHQVKVITSNSGGKIGKTVKNKNLSIYYLKCSSFFGHPIFSEKKLAPHIDWADIIHTTTFTAALPSIKLAKKYHKPCILMVHEVIFNNWFFIEKNPFKALGFFFFEWYVINKKYSLWQTISKATKKNLLKYPIPIEQIITIYHGIDYSIWHPNVLPRNLYELFSVPKSKKIFLYNGRPGKTKGIFILFDAIKKISNDIPKNFIFGFILSKTPSSERKKFIKLVKKYNLQNLIKISSSLPYNELPGYRKNAFAFIVPSITEGFGFTTAETAALNVPLIASNAGSIPEVASGKVLFFKNKDSNDLAKKILLATENKFKNIPEKRFKWNKTIDEIEKVYIKLLNN